MLEIKKGVTPIFVIFEVSVVFGREFEAPPTGDIHEPKTLPDVKIFLFKTSLVRNHNRNSTVNKL